jgi:hypothetical protein
VEAPKERPMELGGSTLILDDLRESPIRRGTGFDLPVALTLGGDVLSRFIVTIDIRARKLVLALVEYLRNWPETALCPTTRLLGSQGRSHFSE